MSAAVEVQYANRSPWAPARHRITRWIDATLGRRARAEVSVRVVGSAESRRLNHRYRGKNKPTNVLSFPGTWDLVVCAPVVAREARVQGKSREQHWAHMIVHGTLHLMGYDHEADGDARRMERREITVLARLGFDDPYGDDERG